MADRNVRCRGARQEVEKRQVAGFVFDRDFLNGYNKIEYNRCYTDAAYTIEGRASV